MSTGLLTVERSPGRGRYFRSRERGRLRSPRRGRVSLSGERIGGLHGWEQGLGCRARALCCGVSACAGLCGSIGRVRRAWSWPETRVAPLVVCLLCDVVFVGLCGGWLTSGVVLRRAVLTCGCFW